jgi:hypothetical protein
MARCSESAVWMMRREMGINRRPELYLNDESYLKDDATKALRTASGMEECSDMYGRGREYQ